MVIFNLLFYFLSLLFILAPTPRKKAASKPVQGQISRKGKKAMFVGDLSTLETVAKKSQAISQGPPFMVETIRSYSPIVQQEETN